MEGEDLKLCLYDCLKAAGLQHYYARLTSVGVRCAAHLSRVTMEDYPILGICSMEDRTRLFQLVQVVKTLDLESEDDDYDTGCGEEGYAEAESSITYDGRGDPDEDVYDDEDETGAAVSELKADSFSRASRVRKRLDFSCESIDHHEKLSSHPVGTVVSTDCYAYASHDRDNDPCQDRGPTIPVHLGVDTGSTVVWTCEGINNHKPDAHSHQYDHHKRANTKPDFVNRNSMHNFHTRLSPKCVSAHIPKPKPETVVSKRFSNRLVGHKDGKGISRKEKLSAEIISNGASVTTMPVYQAKRPAGYNYGLPLSSPPTPNKRQPRGQRINVCVRKRPLTRTECMRGEADVVTTSSGECVIVHESKEAVDLRQYTLQHRFYFDQVFGEESSNEEVYQRTAYPLVQHMLNGGKATCFAYGQTGAGKTHTMLGSSPRRPGLYALAARDIFAHLSTTHTHSPFLVFVSFFEIYCGQLYDLLDHRKRLFAREDGQKVVHIAGLRIVRVDSVSSLLEVISQGTEERTQGTSGVNPLSSRSHALLQIQLRGTNQQIAGKLWFVDLAGSERASDTKDPDKQSRVEGAEINQSLLALKECIRSLDQEQSHTPFRQSKLTQILKDSFVGDSMTCMIANISPGHFTTEHTLNTLRYADRVKELRRQDGLRGGRRGKTIPSPKHNLLNCSSGGSRVCTRGKSPPKKAKLGKQREAFSPTAPTSRLTTGGTILCSTAKNSRWKEETRARKRIGLEQITPIRGLLGIGDKRERKERAGQGKDRRRETYGGNDSANRPICDQNIGAGLVLGQSTEKQLHLRGIQRKSVLYHREKENQQSNLKGGREGESRWIEQRRQLENSEDTCSEVERLRETDLQKVDERDKERERHLKWYHQQLQQFMPSPASSSDHPFFTSTCPSFSPSNQAFFSSSVSESSVQHSSHISVSTLMHHDLEKVLDGYRAKVEVRTDGNSGQLSSFPRGEISLQTETSPRYNKNTFEVGCGDSGGISEDWSVSLEGTEAGFEQDSGKSEKMRSLRATGEREVRVRREDWGPVGMERRGERKLAFMTETEQTNRMKGTRPADVQPLMSNSCDSEMDKKGCLDASNVQPDAVWSTEEQEGTDGYSLVSTYSNNDRNSIFNHPPVKSPHQRAPAERPLSPAFTHTKTFVTHNKLGNLSLKLKNTRLTSNILPLPLENPQQGVSSSSFKEKEPLFAANTNRREFANAHLASQPLSTPITKNGCEILVESLNILSENPDYTQVHNHPEAKDNMLVLAQGETSTDSLGYIIDPLSISLLEVDQQVATASFLQGEHSDSSLCLLEMGECKRKELDKDHRKCSEIAGKAIEDEDVEFCLSLLELPQAVATQCPSTSGTMIATNHSEGKKRVCFATDERYGIGMMKPPIPEVMLVSLQNQENNQKPKTTPAIEVVDNKAPASPLKPSTCMSTGACAMQSISSSVQHTGSHSSQNLMKNSATQVPPNVHNVHNKFAFSISNPQSESVLDQLNTKRCHTVHSNHSSNSDISIQPNSPAQSDLGKSTSSLQIRPIIHLSTLEDFYHDQWRVVQAHWEQLEEMETLCRKEGTLLWRQPDMAFEEYVCTLGEIMERQACCVHRMIAQLQPYLQTSHSNQPHNQGKDNHDQMI